MSKTGRGVLLEVDSRKDEERLMRMNELAGVKVKVTQPPPRAPAPEDSDSGDMETDLGSALSADPSADPRGCPLSPLVLIKAKCPPSPGPAKAAGGKRYKGLAGPPSGACRASKVLAANTIFKFFDDY
ncbi:hypothetical protein ElyMa_001669600 [Elysia marginata]|uniref:Uncharacterized protein n=1 Tax=Elysia marginata TaxID=1093978 RepID=A0AAV4JT63_9GAST|nr:hypothetical protein ElyMa_001669600 [Elysia marginata]